MDEKQWSLNVLWEKYNELKADLRHLQRHDMYTQGAGGDYDACWASQPSLSGEWVKWEDVEQLLK